MNEDQMAYGKLQIEVLFAYPRVIEGLDGESMEIDLAQVGRAIGLGIQLLVPGVLHVHPIGTDEEALIGLTGDEMRAEALACEIGASLASID